MKVIKRGVMPDGTDVQIEDWSGSYPGVHKYADVVAAYPVSQCNLDGAFAPKAGEKFRCGLHFWDTEKAAEAFNALLSGTAELKDYAANMERLDYAPCIGAEPERRIVGHKEA